MNWYRVEYYVAGRRPTQRCFVYVQAHSAEDALVCEETHKGRYFGFSRIVAIICVEKPPTVSERTSDEEVREGYYFPMRNKSSTQL